MSKKHTMVDVHLIGKTKGWLCYALYERSKTGEIIRHESVTGKKEWALQAAELLRLKWLNGDE